MSAPVDVLAVMDIAATSIEHSGGDVAYLRQARAAVAELIEAAKYLHIVTAGLSGNVDANERAALAAALARVKGGAA
ncbi:hypothetical protein [Stenotrophomonas sp. PSU-St15]